VLVTKVAARDTSFVAVRDKSTKKKEGKEKKEKKCHVVLVAVRDKSSKTEDDLFMRP